MSGDGAPMGRPLRPGDPAELGLYRVTARLGEGGMGSVYLAAAADGRLVAIKVIRDELADNAEFRRRFRSEVARAREVPPFCTAEVLDADTEHEPPYLVVEYVDGPSLSSVVKSRGPLTPANQHGLAVGVAVALTAIHGAGVIHRDLKPSNVLLAPGSPKVIDFGIAQGVDGSDADTRTDQLVGTVPYMAPERFAGKAKGPLTPASDIFSWAAVIAYAATGRSPFEAEIPAAVAVRIMSDPPDLSGMSGPLRDLVEQGLAKNPADRPTARQLLDHLLSAGVPGPARTTAFPQQPEVLAAAGIQVTAVIPAVSPTHWATAAGPTAAPVGADAAAGLGAGATFAHGRTAVPVGPTPVPVGPTPTAVMPPVRQPPPTLLPVRPGRPRDPDPGPGSRGTRRGSAFAIALLSVAVLLLAGTVTAFATGALKLPGGAAPTSGLGLGSNGPTTTSSGPPTSPPSPTPTTDPSASTSASAQPTDPSVVPGSNLVMDDSFPTGDTYWTPTSDDAAGGTCTVNGVLTANLTIAPTVSYRCHGIASAFTDVTVKVDVEIGNIGSCAAIWLRYNDSPAGGYAVKICHDRVQVVAHEQKRVVQLDEFYYTSGYTSGPDALLEPGTVAHFAIQASGNTLTVFRNNTNLGSVTDDTFTTGRIVLGVFAYANGSPAPYQAIFHRVQVFRPPAA